MSSKAEAPANSKRTTMNRAAILALNALIATPAMTVSDPFERIWAAPLSGFLDRTKPEKRSRTSSHKQNARKSKKKGQP